MRPFIANRMRRALLSLFICVLYACSDEWHQTFVYGRSGMASDVVIDTIGAGIALIILMAVSRLIHKT